MADWKTRKAWADGRRPKFFKSKHANDCPAGFLGPASTKTIRRPGKCRNKFKPLTPQKIAPKVDPKMAQKPKKVFSGKTILRPKFLTQSEAWKDLLEV